MAADGRSFAPEDIALVERVAARIVALRLEVPAILTLESSRPLSLIAGQSLAFFQPFVQAMFPLPDYERFARLLERRDALDLLVTRIETFAADAHANRDAGRARRAGPRP